MCSVYHSLIKHSLLHILLLVQATSVYFSYASVPDVAEDSFSLFEKDRPTRKRSDFFHMAHVSNAVLCTAVNVVYSHKDANRDGRG